MKPGNHILWAAMAGVLISAAVPAQAGEGAPAGNPRQGKSIYESTCVFCHGANGKGQIPGVPDFTRSNGPLTKSDAELFDNISIGFESPGSTMPMPPRGGNPELTDVDICNVLAYLRQKWGHK